jgi:hypothetical protein
MENKFTLLLLGPAGSGKSAFVAGLSKIDIFKYIAAKKQGGANTTKIATTYEFSSKCEQFQIINCVSVDNKYQEELLTELQNISISEEGITKVFEKINNSDFSKKCSSITIQLPCKENLISEYSLFDTIVVRDTRGFGDVDDNNDINIEEIGITNDVNAIMFFSISSIQQPVIFSKIIQNVISFNLKTPMFLLRRDPDLTQNDVDFENSIIDNISNTDKELSKIILSLGELEIKSKINNLVFNMPEVKGWKGAINVTNEQTKMEIENYSAAVYDILHYAIAMYDKLYIELVEKMQGKYQNLFTEKVLNQLLSDDAFEIAANIVRYPHVKPSTDYHAYRDTAALASPVSLDGTNSIGERPFENERRTRGNRYKDGTIPSYSYSCVNFRNIFKEIVSKLVLDSQLVPLFCTFLNIVLQDSTITTKTGYTFEDCNQDAFKFNIFVTVRESCTLLLSKNNLVDNSTTWKSFSYAPNQKKYEGYEAIAVLMYKQLIKSLNLSALYQKYQETMLHEESLTFVQTQKKGEILEQIKRK